MRLFSIILRVQNMYKSQKLIHLYSVLKLDRKWKADATRVLQYDTNVKKWRALGGPLEPLALHRALFNECTSTRRSSSGRHRRSLPQHLLQYYKRCVPLSGGTRLWRLVRAHHQHIVGAHVLSSLADCSATRSPCTLIGGRTFSSYSTQGSNAGERTACPICTNNQTYVYVTVQQCCPQVPGYRAKLLAPTNS